MSNIIPVVDFSAFGIDKGDDIVPEDHDKAKVIENVNRAFRRVGFVYLMGHGIPEEQICNVFKTAEDFFDLPQCTKDKYTILNDEYYGYAPMERERLDPAKPGDLKETYSYIPYDESEPKNIPTDELPECHDHFRTLFRSCTKLSLRVLEIMASGLNLESDFFAPKFRRVGTLDNTSCIRVLHYPPLPPEKEIHKHQLRLGEHSDYGAITLLLQDNIGGLEVASRDGNFIAATPLPGAVLVNIGDMMQRWTSDKMISNKHRVVIPTEKKLRQCARRSMAFFVQPDNETVIQCLDGSEKYPPVTSLDYLDMKFKAAFY